MLPHHAWRWSFLPIPLALTACSGATSSLTGTDAGTGRDGGGGPDAAMTTDGGVRPPAKSTRVDLLFMIDNSPSMGDKQALLAKAVPDIITRLVSPECVDASRLPTGQNAMPDGTCPAGSTAEFPPVHDLHLAIVSSSLGGRGGDVCPDSQTNPVNPSLSAHANDQGHLINRGGVAGDPTVENTPGTPDAPSPENYLSWFPNVAANHGQPAPSTPPVTGASTLISDFTSLVVGVHDHGCGFEAQNEAWYRFLVQPDPFESIVKNGTKATLQGIDSTLLLQRHDFLRPDSLVGILVVTDENEEAADPLALAAQGWAFNNSSFPGSPNGAAPEGTIECQALDPNNPSTTGPNDPNCTSCAFNNLGGNALRCPKDGTSGTMGYLDPSDDAINTRFFHQKLRFGLTTSYPTARYLRGLKKSTVPSVGLAFPGDTDHEHDMNGAYIGDQDSQANCGNPLFSRDLPVALGQDLCHLTPGPRSPALVFYVAIAGVPHQLLQLDPNNPDSPQKPALTDADWVQIMGRDPEHYDFRGADFHMIESLEPRTTNTTGWANASQCSPGSLDDCDPINGREWSTSNDDLEFACIFPLPSPKDCTAPEFMNACDCGSGALNAGTQLCQKDSIGMYTTTQINGKAYPSIREMVIAHGMGTQGVVSSLCPIHSVPANSDNPPDPLYGYRPAMNAFVTRVAASIGP